MSIKDTVLSSSPDLNKIIEKAVKRIGENHALARDNKGVEMKAQEIEEDRKKFRENRVIEESLKAVADEMAEKMVLENTIENMVKETLQGETAIGNEISSGVGFKTKQGTSNTLDRFKKRQETGEMEEQVTRMPPPLKTIKVELAWPKLPLWFRKLFLKRHKTNKKFKGCTIKGCNVWDTVSKSEKNKLKVELEKEGVTEKKIDKTLEETVKKLVNKKLNNKKSIAEAEKIPGLDSYQKAVKKSKSFNDTAMKDSAKKFKEYDTFEGGESPKFPHQESSKTNNDGQFQYYRNDKESDEFIEDFGHPGLLDFDINNVDMEKLADYLEGSAETGNAQTDKDGNPLGNVVPSDLGEKMLKSSKRRKEKIADEKASMTNLRGYTPDVQKVKQVKEGVGMDIKDMKKLWSYNKKTQ
tara:strand:+ start:39 stop:1271 length:1233 start_codon:yes stop_codon:yes gene_type:complete